MYIIIIVIIIIIIMTGLMLLPFSKLVEHDWLENEPSRSSLPIDARAACVCRGDLRLDPAESDRTSSDLMWLHASAERP